MCQLKEKRDAKHLQTHNIKQMAKILQDRDQAALHKQRRQRQRRLRKKYGLKIPHKRDSLTNAAQHILFAQNRANSFSCSLKI